MSDARRAVIAAATRYGAMRQHMEAIRAIQPELVAALVADAKGTGLSLAELANLMGMSRRTLERLSAHTESKTSAEDQ